MVPGMHRADSHIRFRCLYTGNKSRVAEKKHNMSLKQLLLLLLRA